MANVYYTCSLLPPALVTRSGHSLRWLGDHLQDASVRARRDSLGVHPMTCPYVTRLVTAAEAVLAEAPPEDCVVVSGGCDAMRRLGDLLASAYPERVHVLSVPRSSAPGASETLAGGLVSLQQWLQEKSALASSPTAAPAKAASAADGPPFEYPHLPQPGGVFVVAGPLSDDSFLRLIDDLGARIAGLESCTSPDRWKALGSPATEDAAPESLAALILEAGMCPRRSTSDRRAHLTRRLDQARPSSIIYARQSFCDPGAYDALEVARLAQERELPFLELEVGFPFEASGPLRTRVEAFLEAQSLDDDLLDDLLDELDDPDADALMKAGG